MIIMFGDTAAMLSFLKDSYCKLTAFVAGVCTLLAVGFGIAKLLPFSNMPDLKVFKTSPLDYNEKIFTYGFCIEKILVALNSAFKVLISGYLFENFSIDPLSYI